jgi:hypothetical protein
LKASGKSIKGFPVFTGFETWSLTLREGPTLKSLENRVLRKVFGPERQELRGKCRELYNEVLHEWYSAPNII